jgi:MFS family permease
MFSSQRGNPADGASADAASRDHPEGARSGENGQRKRNLSLLTAAQTLYHCGISIDLTLTGIVGYQLAPQPVWATLPYALISVGSGLVAYPASAFMSRFSRKSGFLIGSSAAVIGGLVSVAAIWMQSFLLFCFGVGCIGIYQAFASYYRYTAADISAPKQRGQAISTVLSGGVVAAVAGPFIATSAKDVLRVPYAGSYLLVTLLALVSIGVLALLTVDKMVSASITSAKSAVDDGVQHQESRPLGVIVRQLVFISGVAGTGIAAFSMNLTMTASPIAAMNHHHTVEQSAQIIQWHMVGMYATAFISGRLCQRIGPPWTLLAGTGVMALGAITGASGTSQHQFMLTLGLIGVGWNLMYVSGSALVAASYRPHESGRVQGIGEFCTLSSSAAGALSAALLLSLLGWSHLSAAVLLPLLVCLILTVSYLVSQSSRQHGETSTA